MRTLDTIVFWSDRGNISSNYAHDHKLSELGVNVGYIHPSVHHDDVNLFVNEPCFCEVLIKSLSVKLGFIDGA